MSWVDKTYLQKQIRKEVKKAMNSPEFLEEKKKGEEQAALRAYCRLCLVTCDYLQIRHGYKKNGIVNFLKYASEIMTYVSDEDEKYFEDMNQVMVDECGIDVLETLGMKIKKEKKDGN